MSNFHSRLKYVENLKETEDRELENRAKSSVIHFNLFPRIIENYRFNLPFNVLVLKFLIFNIATIIYSEIVFL